MRFRSWRRARWKACEGFLKSEEPERDALITSRTGGEGMAKRERERIHYAEPLASAPALFSQLSSPATREFTRRLRRFGYGFDHVADRGHLRRALEKVNYAGGTRPLSISKERVERIVCELRITDFSRYNSSFRPPIRRLVWKFERWKFRWKERGCSRLEKYWLYFESDSLT